jgi:hypothetical protein
LTNPEASPESLGGAGHRQGHQHGNRQPGTETQQHHRRQQIREVVRMHWNAGEQNQSRGNGRETRREHGPGPESGAQSRRHAQRQRPDHDCDWQECQADPHRVVTQDQLQIQRTEEKHPEQPGDREGLDEVRRPDLA